MVRLIFILTLSLFFLSCTDDPRDSRGGGPVASGPYEGTTQYHNELVYTLNGPNYNDISKFYLNFEYTGLDLTVQSAHNVNGGSLQIQLYDRYDNLILHNTVNINGDLTQHFLLDLSTRPAYVIFDASGYSGNPVVVTMKSYAR